MKSIFAISFIFLKILAFHTICLRTIVVSTFVVDLGVLGVVPSVFCIHFLGVLAALSASIIHFPVQISLCQGRLPSYSSRPFYQHLYMYLHRSPPWSVCHFCLPVSHNIQSPVAPIIDSYVDQH